MDYIRESILKGNLKLVESICECGEHFWTTRGGRFTCPYCQDINTYINETMIIKFEGVNDEKETKEQD